MPDRETVEGWSNYPTWAVNLWLANDRKLYEEALKRVRGVDSIEDVPEMLKAWVTDQMPDLSRWNGPSGPACAESLLSYALGEVDWYELAQEWLNNVREATA
ncbi:MAG: hypothetical protein ACHQC8_02730 [Solirubrobacterales bacterium]